MFSRPKILFLVSLLFVALLNSIPTYLLNFNFFIINWDHTTFKLVPSSNWTIERREPNVLKSLQLMTSDRLLVSLHALCQGTSYRFNLFIKEPHLRAIPILCHFQVIGTSPILLTIGLMSRLLTMEKIIIPYVIQKRKYLNLDDSHSALVIFDIFKGQCTTDVLKLLEDINIQA